MLPAGPGLRARRHGARARLLGLMASALASVPATAGGPSADATCPPPAEDAHAVAAIPAATSLLLGDATEVRLAGVLAPSVRDVPAAATTWPLEATARAATEKLVAGRRVHVAATGAFRDRYGRRVAHIISDVVADVVAENPEAGEGSRRVWLQAALVEAGLARVAPLPGETLYLLPLLEREAVARATRAGLWGNPAYAVRTARETRTLNALIGTFQIVEGWVAATGATRSEAFLNFGRDWRWDFTAAVDLRRTPERDALLARLKKLEGRYVRVRGWLEKRNGPFIALATADAIEELPEGLAAGR